MIALDWKIYRRLQKRSDDILNYIYEKVRKDVELIPIFVLHYEYKKIVYANFG